MSYKKKKKIFIKKKNFKLYSYDNDNDDNIA